MSYNKTIFKGLAWNITELIIDRGFSFLVNLYLVSVLVPEDFGVVGMASLFISIFQVFNDLGMGAALIQKKDSLLNDDYFNTAFFTGIFWSVLFYLFVGFVVGPLAADFFNQPILSTLMPFLSIGILINPLVLIHRVKLTRQLDFKKLSIVNNIGNVLSGIAAIVTAASGFGVWALVVNAASASLFRLPVFMYFTKWFPRLTWSFSKFKEISWFGIFTIGTNMVNRLISQSDYLIIGKLAGAYFLGIYTFAFLITNILRNQIVFLLNKVMFPIYGKLQDDFERASEYFYKVMRFNALIVYPITLLIVLFSEDFLRLLYGDKWLESVPIIKVLSLSVFVGMTINSYNAFLRGMGQPRLEFFTQVVKFMIFIPCMYFGYLKGHVVGVAWGHFIATTIHTAYVSFILVHRLKLEWRLIADAVWVSFSIAAIIYAIGWTFQMLGVPGYINVICVLALIALSYFVFHNRELTTVYKLLRGRKNIRETT